MMRNTKFCRHPMRMVAKSTRAFPSLEITALWIRLAMQKTNLVHSFAFKICIVFFRNGKLHDVRLLLATFVGDRLAGHIVIIGSLFCEAICIFAIHHNIISALFLHMCPSLSLQHAVFEVNNCGDTRTRGEIARV